MTPAITALFLLGPLVAVPIWLRLIPDPEPTAAARLLGLTRTMSLPAGIALAAAFSQSPGFLAGALAAPWLAMAVLGGTAAGLAAITAIRTRATLRPRPDHAAWAALVFLGVSAGNAFADRLGIQPFDFSATVILLTAVHFTFAGFVLPLAGAAAYRREPRLWLALAIGLVIVGIPITAFGFFGIAAAAWLGALLVSIGGLGIGLATLATAAHAEMRSQTAARLAALAGLSLLISMPLAAIYGTGAWLQLTWLDVPTMARTHGALNVAGFALPISVAWWLDHQTSERRAGAVTAGPR